jgi:DNA-binding beta-propeller fold protein YncE
LTALYAIDFVLGAMEDPPVSQKKAGWSRRRARASAIPALRVIIAASIGILFLFSSMGAALASPVVSLRSLENSAGASPVRGAVSGPANRSILSSCPLVGAIGPLVYDPEDGYLYVGALHNLSTPGSLVYVVRPPCDVVASVNISGGIGFSGMAYDPSSGEVVLGPTVYSTVAYVFQGSSLVANFTLQQFGPACLLDSPVTWDPVIDAILVGVCGAVTLLYLSVVNGVTIAKITPNAFAINDFPTALLVADGYIFLGSNTVFVFNDRTLALVGSFPQLTIYGGGFCTSLAWDPMKNSVVVGVCVGNSVIGPVVFLSAAGLATGHFTFSRLKAPGILAGGVGDVAYSPTTREVYLTAALGNDVWEVSESGALTHVYLGQDSEPFPLVYDPSNHDMYVVTELYSYTLENYASILYAIR